MARTVPSQPGIGCPGLRGGLPRRTALNRLNRLRDAGWIDRHGETRATIYHLTEQGRTKLEADQTSQPSSTGSQGSARLSRVATVLSQKGQIVLPGVIRDQLHLQAGDDFEVTVEDEDTITLRRIAHPADRGLVDLLLACPAPFEIPEREKDDSAPFGF